MLQVIQHGNDVDSEGLTSVGVITQNGKALSLHFYQVLLLQSTYYMNIIYAYIMYIYIIIYIYIHTYTHMVKCIHIQASRYLEPAVQAVFRNQPFDLSNLIHKTFDSQPSSGVAVGDDSNHAAGHCLARQCYRSFIFNGTASAILCTGSPVARKSVVVVMFFWSNHIYIYTHTYI